MIRSGKAAAARRPGRRGQRRLDGRDGSRAVPRRLRGATNAPACLGVDTFTGAVGAVALARDFSINSETGKGDQHTLVMNRGAMLRQQLDYETTGEDHAHMVAFTVEQLGALMSGQTVVVEMHGPPLNASSGHSHTVTVHRASLSRRRVTLDPTLTRAAYEHAVSGSAEFQVLVQSGEDQLVACPSCSYAANLEVATSKPLPAEGTADGVPAREKVHTRAPAASRTCRSS